MNGGSRAIHCYLPMPLDEPLPDSSNKYIASAITHTRKL
jgi:hypothetical protein